MALEGFTARNRELLQNVATIHYDPFLEEIAIRSLDDPDPQVAATAARMLGNFGSAAAESALWQRYASWSAKWAGRDEQLNRMWAEPVDENIYQLGLGQNLVQALATGQSWLADKNKLQRLSQITKVQRLQEQVDSYLRNWQYETMSIAIENRSAQARFRAQLAQYELYSMKDLKEKISQFPSGTKFSLSNSSPGSPAGDKSLIELQAFVTAHGASKN